MEVEQTPRWYSAFQKSQANSNQHWPLTADTRLLRVP